MRIPLRFTPYIIVLTFLAGGFSSCEVINPDEQIPAFLRIDSITLNAGTDEGTDDANITDAWVYENEKLVGIYELPAIVPVLKNGEANIRIRGGIKLNGQVGTRIPYLFTEDMQTTLELFPDSQLHVNPTLEFLNWVNFPWLDEFEGGGVLSLTATNLSDTDPERVEGAEAYQGKSLKMALGPDDLIFECRTGAAYELPGGGDPVILEFTYRCNHSFVVGLFSSYSGGTYQIPVMVINPSEDWNRIYVNLTDVVSSNSSFIDHSPFFGFIKDSDFEGEAHVYLDNVRLLH